MKHRLKQQSISSLAALLVFGIFAVGILSVLLSGAGAYQRLTERDRLAYDSRTCAQYVATKVRQAAAPDAVRVESFGGVDALVIVQVYDGVEYWNRIYCHDGWLKELFTAAEGEFAPEDGEKILQAQKLELEWRDNLLCIELTDGNGTPMELNLALRTGEVGA